MIYVYIELRYQRQLSRICPDVPAGFFSALGESVRKNGGTILRASAANLYEFDDASVGFAFSASRAIFDLRELLAENREYIREYFCLVDSTPKRMSSEAFRERLRAYDSMITPDEGIMLTTPARECLAPYLSFVQYEDTPLGLYTGQRVSEYQDNALKGDSTEEGLRLYTDGPCGARDAVSVLRDLVYIAELGAETGPEPGGDGEESAERDGHNALDVVSLFRYSAGQPGYRTKAALDYLTSRLRRLERNSGRQIRVAVYGKGPLPASFEPLADILGSRCDFTERRDTMYLPDDVKNMPVDLLELAYLTYRVLDFIYLDELPSFYQYLDKQADFMKSLGTWMYNYGLLADPADPRSINPALRDTVFEKNAVNRKKLDARIGGFLLERHEMGMLMADYDLYRVFTELDCTVQDGFLVRCILGSADPVEGVDRYYGKFKDKGIADYVRTLERAIGKFSKGEYAEANALSKDTLHAFQKGGILSGEYRTLILISMLSFVQGKRDDAIVYLEYALENAEKMRDPFILLETKCVMAVIYFAIGSLHFARCTLDAAEHLASRCFAKGTESLVVFMKGRVFFELGDYRNADLAFQASSAIASAYLFTEQVALCRVWYARALAHQSRYHSADQIFRECLTAVPESYLFLLESAILSGRPLVDLEYPVGLESLLTDTSPWPDAFASWKSGFTFSEDLIAGIVSENKTAVRMYAAFRLFYRARFERGVSAEEMISGIEEVAKAALDRQDPFAALYFYICFELGSRMPGGFKPDVLVYLSRGFKYLQKRANEIGDNGLREQFMQNPVWNNRLYRAARENMLI